MNRYTNATQIMGGVALSSTSNTETIRAAIANGTLGFAQRVLKENERLDHIAGQAYGDSTMWWVIAAASSIGWGLQVPAGTLITIPNKAQVEKL